MPGFSGPHREPRSIRRHRRPRTSRPPSLAWRSFLRNELAGIWAADLLVVQTLTFKTLYVLFFIQHQRRQPVHLNVTAHPTVAWVWQQLLNATPDGRQPQYLLHDRDGECCRGADGPHVPPGVPRPRDRVE